MSKTGSELRLRTGQLLLLTDGCYSDYGIQCLLRALVDLDMREEYERWLNEVYRPARKQEKRWDDIESFATWLVRLQKVEQVEYMEANQSEDLAAGHYPLDQEPGQ